VTDASAGVPEEVLVVPRSLVPDAGGWYGLRTDGLEPFLDVVAAHGRYRPRADMEVDREHKQIIPYVVLRDGDAYFLMRRTRAGGDVRLHDRFSIGVGGHLNPGDDGIPGGLRREWHEEVVAAFEPEFVPLALLNDDTTDVGAVHLGIVFLAEAAGRPVSIRETDKLSGSFVPPSAVAAVADRLETWSRLVFEALAGAALR
jgi:predicted NUDIX family phosphoesterase